MTQTIRLLIRKPSVSFLVGLSWFASTGACAAQPSWSVGKMPWHDITQNAADASFSEYLSNLSARQTEYNSACGKFGLAMVPVSGSVSRSGLNATDFAQCQGKYDAIQNVQKGFDWLVKKNASKLKSIQDFYHKGNMCVGIETLPEGSVLPFRADVDLPESSRVEGVSDSGRRTQACRIAVDYMNRLKQNGTDIKNYKDALKAADASKNFVYGPCMSFSDLKKDPDLNRANRTVFKGSPAFMMQFVENGADGRCCPNDQSAPGDCQVEAGSVKAAGTMKNTGVNCKGQGTFSYNVNGATLFKPSQTNGKVYRCVSNAERNGQCAWKVGPILRSKVNEEHTNALFTNAVSGDAAKGNLLRQNVFTTGIVSCGNLKRRVACNVKGFHKVDSPVPVVASTNPTGSDEAGLEEGEDEQGPGSNDPGGNDPTTTRPVAPKFAYEHFAAADCVQDDHRFQFQPGDKPDGTNRVKNSEGSAGSAE